MVRACAGWQVLLALHLLKWTNGRAMDALVAVATRSREDEGAPCASQSRQRDLAVLAEIKLQALHACLQESLLYICRTFKF
jgi:hypothetical protein